MGKFPWSAVINTSGGLFSSIFGNSSQNKNIDKQIAAQKEENQKNREWNLQLAEKANQWSIDQWNRENEYNTPVETMKRIREGGLNADLMYGNGTTGLQAAGSPAVTPSAPSSPTDMSSLANKKTIGQTVSEGLDAGLKAAQLAAINAQTNKTKVETVGTESDNVIKAAAAAVAGIKESGILRMQALDIQLSEEQVKFVREANPRQLKILDNDIQAGLKSIENIEQAIQESQARVSNLTFNQLMSVLEYQLKESDVRSQIVSRLVQNGYTLAQTRSIIQKLPHELAQLAASAKVATATADSDITIRKNSALQSTWEMLEGEADFNFNRPKRDVKNKTNSGSSDVKNQFGFVPQSLSLLEFLIDHTLGAINVFGK